MKTTFLLYFFSFFILSSAIGQDMSIFGFYRENGSPPEDYLLLGQMDPLTGSFIELDTIDQINAFALASSTFDQANQYYIFKGVDTGSVMKLISRDVVNNSTIFAHENNFTINDFQYDMNSQTLYALGNYKVDSVLIDTTNGIYMYEYASRFMSINIESGDAEEIGLLPELRAFPIGNSTFDSNNGRYIVCGFDPEFATRIFVIDSETGQLLSDTEVALDNGQYMNELEFNNEDNTMYGIYRDNNLGLMALASVDMESGEIVVIEELDDAFAFTPGASVFDQLSQSFIFNYYSAANQARLVVYDIASEIEISNVPISGYFTELEVDNSAYATLKYGTTIISQLTSERDVLNVYPNPATLHFNVYCEKKFSTIKVYDLTGQEVFQSTCKNRNEDAVSTSGFDPGIYFVRIETGDDIHTKKIVIE